MSDTVFKSTAEMPPKNNSPDVVRVALTMPEARRNYTPGSFPNGDASVESVERPRRGHGY